MTVYYVLHVNAQRKLGGIKTIYRHVDILNKAGIDAAVVHGVRGFRCEWFDNDTRVEYPPIRVTDRDVLAYPEVAAVLMAHAAEGVPKVSVNQGAYLALTHAAEAYSSCVDLRAVTVVSDQNMSLMRYAFPYLNVQRIRQSIDPQVFYPVAGARPRRIAYMPRRRKTEAHQVLAILRSRGELDGWEVAPIDGLDQRGVADALRLSPLFLSFADHEGFGLPALEALACGCQVIGYSGFGGDDYFGGEDCQPVPDGDVQAFAEAVAAWLRGYDTCRPWLDAQTRAARYLGLYRPEAEEKSVVEFWTGVLEDLPPSRDVTRTLTAADTLKSTPMPRWYLWLAKAKAALRPSR